MPRTDTSESSDSELVLRYGELEISVRSRAGSHHTHTSSVAGSPAPGSPVLTSATSYQSAGETPLAGPRASATSVAERRALLESELLAARSPEDFLSLDLQVVEHLLPWQRARSCGGWTPAARLGRAYRAGLIAKANLSDEPVYLTSPPIPLRNTVYVVLRGKPGQPAGWTTEYGIYFRAVSGGAQSNFHPQSVSHAFATRAEVEAYLLGAEAEWPLAYQ
eukprot:s978_g3.t1